ncbi:MarR family winged helix-turn-helix transcriptional regulator [Streptomyces sp. NPDC054796]
MNGERDGERNDEDVVAGVLRQWQRVHPGLDTAPMAVIGRLNRCAALLQQAAEAPLSQEGLTRAEFDILGTLRRVDRELTPGRIARETFASGAAVTKRLKELERRGLVVRRPDERDRRVAHLSLTEAGSELIDRLLPEQLGYEAALLAGLDGARRQELSSALGELLVVLEGRLGSVVG